MNKKYWIVIFSTILAVTLTFLFCKMNVSHSKNAEIVFQTLQMNDFSNYINKVIRDFEKENPDIKVKWVDVPFSEGEKRTLASVLSDNPPDLINLNPDFSNTLARKGALYEIPVQSMSQFKPEILNILKIDGRFFAFPWYVTSAITIYNKKIIPNPPPKTYSDLFLLSAKIRKTKNAYAFLPNITENDTMLKILNKYGINDSSKINSQKSIDLFNEFKNLYNRGNIPKETLTITLQESLEKYMAGNIGLLNAGANFLNLIKENAPEIYKNTAISTQISGDLGQYDFSLMNLVIPLKSKNKESALKFAIFLTNENNQLELAKLTNIIAVNKNTLKNQFFTESKNNDLLEQSRIISAKQLDNIYPPYIPHKNQKDLNNIINTATQEILLNKNDTKTILNKVSQNWKKIEEGEK